MNRTVKTNIIIRRNIMAVIFISLLSIVTYSQNGQEDPQITITPSVALMEDCTFDGLLTLELQNYDITSFSLPYDVYLEYQEDDAETYHEMTGEYLEINDLLIGSYVVEIFYSDGCTETFSVDLDFSEEGIKAVIFADDICNQSSVSVGLYNIKDNLDNPLSDYSVEWTKDGEEMDGLDDKVNISEGGEYCATVTDNNTGCEAKFCETVIDYKSFFSIDNTQPECSLDLDNGSISLSFQNLDNHYVTVSWTGPDGFAAGDVHNISNLAPGDYTYTIEYKNNQNLQTDCVCKGTETIICDDSPQIGDCPFFVNMPFQGDGNINGLIVSDPMTAVTVEFWTQNPQSEGSAFHIVSIPIQINNPLNVTTGFQWDISSLPAGSYTIEIGTQFQDQPCHIMSYTILEDIPEPTCSNGGEPDQCRILADYSGELEYWTVIYCLDNCDQEGLYAMNLWQPGDLTISCPPCITGDFFQDDGCSNKFITGGRGEFTNTIDFGTNFSNLPVVFANSTQCNDQISMVDISNVSTNNFEISSYVSGSSTVSKNDLISYFAVPQGIINKENLKGIVHKTENVSRLKKHISFENNFKSKPVVFATINQRNSTSRSTVRIDNVTSEGFDIYLQSEKGDNTSNPNESVSYMAFCLPVLPDKLFFQPRKK